MDSCREAFVKLWIVRGALSYMEGWCDAGGCVVGWWLGGVENSYMSVKKVL